MRYSTDEERYGINRHSVFRSAILLLFGAIAMLLLLQSQLSEYQYGLSLSAIGVARSRIDPCLDWIRILSRPQNKVT